MAKQSGHHGVFWNKRPVGSAAFVTATDVRTIRMVPTFSLEDTITRGSRSMEDGMIHARQWIFLSWARFGIFIYSVIVIFVPDKY